MKTSDRADKLIEEYTRNLMKKDVLLKYNNKMPTYEDAIAMLESDSSNGRMMMFDIANYSDSKDERVYLWMASEYEKGQAYNNAAEWYEKASELGNAEARKAYERCYNPYHVDEMVSFSSERINCGTPWINYQNKINELQKKDFENAIGVIFSNPTKQEALKAIDTIRLIADAHGCSVSKALVWMGEYSENFGNNPSEVVKYYKKAAEIKSIEGSKHYADMLIYGNGVEKDKDLAIEYYIFAADNGNPVAQFIVGQYYRSIKDERLSTKYFSLAKDNGFNPQNTKGIADIIKLPHTDCITSDGVDYLKNILFSRNHDQLESKTNDKDDLIQEKIKFYKSYYKEDYISENDFVSATIQIKRDPTACPRLKAKEKLTKSQQIISLIIAAVIWGLVNTLINYVFRIKLGFFPTVLVVAVFGIGTYKLISTLIKKTFYVQYGEAEGMNSSSKSLTTEEESERKANDKKSPKLNVKTILIILLSVSLLLNIVLFGITISKNKVNTYNKSEYDNKYSELMEKYNKMNKAYSEKTLKLDEIEEKAKFFDDYAVIIAENDEKHYHKYDCSHCDVDTYSFWIYNLDYAKDQGIKPCPYCFE